MNDQHRVGQAFALVATALEGFYPVIAHASVDVLPAFFFAGICMLLSSLVHGVIILSSRRRVPLTPRLLLDALGVSICIVVIPAVCIFTGTKLSSGINTGLLLPVEVPYTVIVSWILFKEKLTPKAVLGIALSFAGVMSIMLSAGRLTGGIGELIIICSIFLLPFGNRLGKKCLTVLRGPELLFLRSLFGGVILLSLSFLFETRPTSIPPHAFTLIAGYTILVLVIGKLVWYEGLKRLRVVDAVAMIGAGPAFSLLFAILFLGERPGLHQGLGFLLIVTGVYLVTHPSARHHSIKE